MIFSADETTDIGYESGTTVTADYTAHASRFTGKINWVQIDLGPTITTTTSIPRNGSASPWPASSETALRTNRRLVSAIMSRTEKSIRVLHGRSDRRWP